MEVTFDVRILFWSVGFVALCSSVIYVLLKNKLSKEFYTKELLNEKFYDREEVDKKFMTKENCLSNQEKYAKNTESIFNLLKQSIEHMQNDIVEIKNQVSYISEQFIHYVSKK